MATSTAATGATAPNSRIPLTEIRDQQQGLLGRVRPIRLRHAHRVSGQDRSRARRDRHRELLSGSRRAAGHRPAVDTGGRSAEGRASRRRILSHAFWTSRFRRGSHASSGGTAIINGHPFTILGVAQAGFDGVEIGRPVQVFVPMMMKLQMTPGWDGLDDRLYRWVRVFGACEGRRNARAGPGRALPLFRASLESDVEVTRGSPARLPRAKHYCGTGSCSIRPRRDIRTSVRS